MHQLFVFKFEYSLCLDLLTEIDSAEFHDLWHEAQKLFVTPKKILARVQRTKNILKLNLEKQYELNSSRILAHTSMISCNYN